MNETSMIEKTTIITLTEAEFRRRVLETGEPFMVEVGAEWSGNCAIMAPIIERLAGEYEGQLQFGRLDIDANEQIAREFGVTELPFLLFFRDGKLADFIIGTASRKTIEDRIAKLLETESK
ncbi:MAG: thioredoxin family protein [Calditrichia bacterium]|nr:thioredoxin family protein [Calditrichia bacterium]